MLVGTAQSVHERRMRVKPCRNARAVTAARQDVSLFYLWLSDYSGIGERIFETKEERAVSG